MKKVITKIIPGLLCIMTMALDCVSQEEILFKTNGQEFIHKKKDRQDEDVNQCEASIYRSIDGTCNNLRHEDWGASDIPLYRSMPSEYGESNHYNAMGGEDRPSPRAISNALCDEDEAILSRMNLSSFVFTWGQFVDHDITLTPEAHDEYEPIELPEDETLFNSEIAFFRSAVHENTGIHNYRQQSNLISSWIDGSNVYGSDEERASWLRTHADGKLKVSEGELLPYNTLDGEFNSEIDPGAPSMAGDGGGSLKVFVAGDIRANEQPGLTALHTIFVRYHNLICDKLKASGLEGDELIYLNARKRVAGVIQSITYKEFLPALGIRLERERGYKPRTQADISNIFATAAYRLGHTMVTDELLLLSDNCKPVGAGSVSLLEGFFNPAIIRTYNVAPILNGLASQVQNETDLKITDNLRNFLFADPSSGMSFGLDLASLNIQRGRDHGLPDYNTVCRKYTGTSARSFRDITRNRDLVRELDRVYDDVNDIDLWVGLLAEDKLRGASVGPTLYSILKAQFESLRDGDRFFYQHDRSLNAQTKREIENTSLSNVISATTGLDGLSANVFIAHPCDARAETISSRNAMTTTQKSEVVLYPNPVRDVLNIDLGTEAEAYKGSTIYLTDIRGQIIEERLIDDSKLLFKLESYDAGYYFIRIESSETTIIKRFIKVN